MDIKVGNTIKYMGEDYSYMKIKAEDISEISVDYTYHDYLTVDGCQRVGQAPNKYMITTSSMSLVKDDCTYDNSQLHAYLNEEGKVSVCGCGCVDVMGYDDLARDRKMPAGGKGLYLKRYIIKPDAAILFWSDGDKTVVTRTKGDKVNKRTAFLNAYFQKLSGMSKTKCNKFLDSLVMQDE